MARSGRKRKLGAREANGRLQRETDWQVLEPSLRRRCAELGIRPTLENMRMVRGQDGGTPWGKLFIKGEITRRMADALQAFWLMRQQYLHSIDAPREHPKGCNATLEPSGASLRGENVDWARRVRQEYLAVEKVLFVAGRAYLLTAKAHVQEMPVRIEQLRHGAELLAEHLLDGQRKVA